MSSKIALVLLIALVLVAEVIGNPLKFPEGTSVSENTDGKSVENSEARFHHHHFHKKKRKKKPGCGGGLHNRFKRADSEGRFFFPILNIYDTDIYVSGGGGQYGDASGSGCGSGFGGSSFGSGLTSSLGGLTGGLGSGLGNLGSGIGNIGNGLGSGLASFGSGFPSIGSGLPSIGSVIPPIGGGPASGGSRPPATPSRPPATPSPPRPPAPVSTTDPDGDNEDYDYSDFSTTVRSRPLGNRRPSSSLSNYPIVNSLTNGIRPVFERPRTYFNQYVVKPINRTIREFYSLF